MIAVALFLFLALLLIGTLLHRRVLSRKIHLTGDVEIYSEHMRGLEADRDKGLVADDEFQAMRAEIGRRMISASRQNLPKENYYKSENKWALAGIIITAFLLGSIIYTQIGTPGRPDFPIERRYAQSDALRANSPSQLEAEALAPTNLVIQDNAYNNLIEDLRNALKLRPDDIHGLALLVKSESRIKNYSAAYTAQENILRLKGDKATAVDWYTYADLLITAADGYISSLAEEALRKVIMLNPENKLALFRMGIYFDQIGRPDRTFTLWRKLLESGPESAPYIPLIRKTIEDLALVAGVNYEPPKPKGPTKDDISNALELTKEERQVMIVEMVASLEKRLTKSGGASSDWAQLIFSHAVLGNDTAAQKTFQEAMILFVGQESDLKILRQAAVSAGIMQ
jgi:cytochrome c-type biogenesis protein CcmH